MTPEQQSIVDRLRTSGEAVQRAVAQVPAGGHTEARDGEWSAQQVLTHTLNAELFAFGLRIHRILVEEDPQFADYNEVEHRERLGAVLSVPELVESIVAEHTLLAHLLSHLPETAWQWHGHHPVHGKRTVEFLARRLVEHCEEHAAQLEQMRGT